jgi:muramoyltetrapeptide carboxypeptidase
LVKITHYSRRQFIQFGGLTGLAAQFSLSVRPLLAKISILKPPKLQAGDTVGLINPASEIEPKDIILIEEFLQQNGFRVKRGQHIFDRYGYLAGKDSSRAADVNNMFADPQVKALLAIRGGWGANRILSLLDYELIRSQPKIIMGYSDITSLLLAIYARTGLITFHGPVGTSQWNDFSANYVRRILSLGEALTLKNPPDMPVKTITPGRVRGRLLGGNLSVLTSAIGSSYLPSWQQAILFVEEIGEDIYRVDRMLTQLKLAGVLEQLSGFIFAQCVDCSSDDDQQFSLTLEQVLFDLIKPLGIPAWYGAAIGHIEDKFTIPVGLEVEIDALQGTIQMLEPAVR